MPSTIYTCTNFQPVEAASACYCEPFICSPSLTTHRPQRQHRLDSSSSKENAVAIVAGHRTLVVRTTACTQQPDIDRLRIVCTTVHNNGIATQKKPPPACQHTKDVRLLRIHIIDTLCQQAPRIPSVGLSPTLAVAVAVGCVHNDKALAPFVSSTTSAQRLKRPDAGQRNLHSHHHSECALCVCRRGECDMRRRLGSVSAKLGKSICVMRFGGQPVRSL